MPQLHATLLTLFPEMFPGPLGHSLAGRALQKGIWSFDTVNIRDFGITRHKNVDDEAYGGGNGLIMRADVLGAALDAALKLYPDSLIYYPSPRGVLFSQEMAQGMVINKNVIILCGRFEGIDERIIDEYNAVQVSIGDYVLSGGEIAALAMLDSAIRLLPGVVANQDTIREESFAENADGYRLLEYPLYTRPRTWRGREVPSVLVSGDHQEVAKWKHDQSLAITKRLRPDLLKHGKTI